MAARSSKKTGIKKKTPRKSATAKTAAKKAPSRAKTARKKTTAKKAPAKKASAKKSTSKPRGRRAASSKTPAKRKSSGIRADQVNLGHLFALRPRVSTAFGTEVFRTAKHRLRDRSFKNIEEAARAVVEQAHELTREKPAFGRKS